MAQQKAVEAQGDHPEDIVDELPAGTKLLRGQYTIVRYLNSGGFGITYLAKDSLDRNVVIKECFPSSYCRRSKTVVAARSRAHTAELRSVVQLFVREARNLAKMVHPNIVAVHQVFEDNFTAYMAIDYIDGLDLQEVIEGKGPQPTAAEIVVMTQKLLGAVGFIHDHDMLHRDISPDNVLIDKAGEPILIDFGAARDEASQKSRAMSALRVVKDGYSPQEFYISGSEQGPWSDLYALGATLYHLISGQPPINGQNRLAALAEGRPDPYEALDGRYAGYPPGFLKAIDKAMNTLPARRVQTAREWLAMISADGVENAVRALMAEGVSSRQGNRQSDDVEFAVPGEGSADFSAATARLAAGGSSKGRSGMPMIAIGVVLLLAAGGGYVMLGGKGTPPPQETAAATETTSTVKTETAAVADSTSSEAAATEPAAETASATPEPAATEAATPEPAAVETAAAEPAAPEPAAPEPAATEAATPDPATPEPAAVEVAATEPAEIEPATTETATADTALAAPAGAPAANQIAFAAWDVVIPFVEENRVIGGKSVAIVSRILPSTKLSEVGEWLAPGLLLFSVNGVEIQQSGSVTAAVLNALQVDPDGKARLVVEFAGESLVHETGLLTVEASRLINLGNGVNLVAKVVDGKWQTVVSGVTAPEKTELRQGDVLFRDKTTGVALDSAGAVETVLAQLVEQGATLTSFSVIRDNKVTSAAMQLVVQP